ncbi:DUF3180 domain-containing protein [Spiractinospora alimapuensis]|nr:DUF3180 domain-containing protein [Spiractinospora alimapuensis]
MTGWRTPVILAVIGVVLGFVVSQWFYLGLPRLPWTAIPTAVVLAVVEMFAAYHVRRRVRRLPGTVPIEPLAAARLLALAKASIAAAALLGGAFTGLALGLLDRVQADAPRLDALVAGGSTLACVVLLVAGFLLERACRVPDQR